MPPAKAASRHAVHFSSANSEWETPPQLIEALNEEFHFTLDPCATPANAKCDRYFTSAQNGLKRDWRDHMVFMNPPYGRAISLWMRKAIDSAQAGATVVCLVPARTDTAWWHEFAMRGEIRFLRGRVKFVGAKHSAPFPSAIVVFRPHGSRHFSSHCSIGSARAERLKFHRLFRWPEETRSCHDARTAGQHVARDGRRAIRSIRSALTPA